MKSFKQYITEKKMLRNAMASAMIGTGMLQATGVPPEQVPGMVSNYWQKKIAPSPEQELNALLIKHSKHMKIDPKSNKNVLDIDSIPDQNDRKRIEELIAMRKANRS